MKNFLLIIGVSLIINSCGPANTYTQPVAYDNSYQMGVDPNGNQAYYVNYYNNGVLTHFWINALLFNQLYYKGGYAALYSYHNYHYYHDPIYRNSYSTYNRYTPKGSVYRPSAPVTRPSSNYNNYNNYNRNSNTPRTSVGSGTMRPSAPSSSSYKSSNYNNYNRTSAPRQSAPSYRPSSPSSRPSSSSSTSRPSAPRR